MRQGRAVTFLSTPSADSDDSVPYLQRAKTSAIRSGFIMRRATSFHSALWSAFVNTHFVHLNSKYPEACCKCDYSMKLLCRGLHT